MISTTDTIEDMKQVYLQMKVKKPIKDVIQEVARENSTDMTKYILKCLAESDDRIAKVIFDQMWIK